MRESGGPTAISEPKLLLGEGDEEVLFFTAMLSRYC